MRILLLVPEGSNIKTPLAGNHQVMQEIIRGDKLKYIINKHPPSGVSSQEIKRRVFNGEVDFTDRLMPITVPRYIFDYLDNGQVYTEDIPDQIY